MLEIALAVARRSLVSALRRPVVLTFSLAQPLVWMALFGFLFAGVVERTAGMTHGYRSFVAPGIALMSVVFGASQSGISIVRDAQTGMLARMGGTRAPAWALLAGKQLGDGVRLVLQGACVLALACALGARFTPRAYALLHATASLGALIVLLGSISCGVAARARAPEPMGTYVHLVNMPLVFTSTALLPGRVMPSWLAAIASVNPLSVAADAWRAALLGTPIPDPERVGAGVVLAVLAFFGASRSLDRAAREAT